jgi:heme exporter protein C
MRTFRLWLLWLLMAGVIVLAFTEPTRPAQGFKGETGRILYFHVPNALTSFVAFLAAGIWSARYLFGARAARHDLAAAVAVELGLVFCAVATISGAIWAEIQWGAFWNWDPRQTSITLAFLFYAGYLTLRSSVEDDAARARASAAYGVLGLAVAPFLFFVLPRLNFSLHPQPLINAEGKILMASAMLWTLLAGVVGFVSLFFWLHGLRCRLAAERARPLG